MISSIAIKQLRFYLGLVIILAIVSQSSFAGDKKRKRHQTLNKPPGQTHEPKRQRQDLASDLSSTHPHAATTGTQDSEEKEEQTQPTRTAYRR